MIYNNLKLAAAMFGLIFMIGCTQAENETTVEITQNVISVKAEIVTQQNVSIIGNFTGSLEGENQSVIYSKISEAVENVLVSEGQTVNDMELLLQLDKTGPSSGYFQAQSLFKNAQKNLKKQEFLYKEGAISESQFDASQTDFEVKKAAFDAAASLVDIKSPIKGVVTSLEVSPGDYVQLGQKLATVATVANLRARFAVGGSEINELKKGAKVEISSLSTNETLSGEIVAIASSANPGTRSFEVEAIINNNGNYYKPGMFVNVSFVRKNISNVLVVPRSAIVELDGQSTVFTVLNNKAVKKDVTLGDEVDGLVVIQSGLTAGDTLVIIGQNYLEDNTAVNITAWSVKTK